MYACLASNQDNIELLITMPTPTPAIRLHMGLKVARNQHSKANWIHLQPSRITPPKPRVLHPDRVLPKQRAARAQQILGIFTQEECFRAAPRHPQIMPYPTQRGITKTLSQHTPPFQIRTAMSTSQKTHLNIQSGIPEGHVRRHARFPPQHPNRSTKQHDQHLPTHQNHKAFQTKNITSHRLPSIVKCNPNGRRLQRQPRPRRLLHRRSTPSP